MANTKVYKIRIDGIDVSIDAVKSLEKELSNLEQRIKALEKQSINIKGGSTTSSTNSSKNTNKGQLTEEQKLAKQIEQIDQKRKAYSKEIYQNYLAAKDVLKETLNDQKEIAAQERLQANTYSNTMRGLKEKLADIKLVMQTTDLDSGAFKGYTKEAGSITQKLKELEEAYGQFGRNVGNYATAADGFNKIKVAVGDTVREYDNYKKAVRELKQERFELSQSLGTEAEEYKNVDKALKTLISDYQDLDKSSAVMDNLFDTMQNFTSLASIGVGLQSLFGVDDKTFNESMQKLTSLVVILKGIESLQLALQKNEGFLAKAFNFGNNKLNEWATMAKKSVVDLAFGLKGVDGELKRVSLQLRGLPTTIGLVQGAIDYLTIAFMALKAAIVGGFLLFIPELINFFSNLIKSLDTTKAAADRAAESMNALTRELENRIELLSSSYLKGEIRDEEYLRKIYDAQTRSLIQQIDYLQLRSKAMEKNASFLHMFNATQNTEFTGKKFEGETTVGRGRFTTWAESGNDLELVVKNINEVEKAWLKCNIAIEQGKDYFDKWEGGIKGLWGSLWATVKDTEEVMRGMGNIKLSDFISQFQMLNKQFNSGSISAEKFGKEVGKLRKEMNNNEVLNSVIANLDKYIPDEGVRTAVQNIINELLRLDDAFNMTSPEQIHYWNQVRIDAMKDGFKKTNAQIEENERYEVQQYGKTQEQIDLIHAKYQRQRLDAQEKYNKERLNKGKAAAKKLEEADNELRKLLIENMKDGKAKELAELNEEERQALNKAKDRGIKVGEIQIQIQEKYAKKRNDLEKKWNYEYLRTYSDFIAKIDQLNKGTMEKEVETASKKTEDKATKNARQIGYSALAPSTYNDTKTLENYYKIISDIEKKAADKEAKIRQESLDKMLEFNQKEEKLRHERVVNADGGELIQQLRAGRISEKEYDELIEKEKEAHNARMNALDKEYSAQTNSLVEENLKSTHSIYSKYFDKILETVRRDKEKIDELAAKQPVTDKEGWDIVNITKTLDNFKEIKNGYTDLKNDLLKKKKEIEKAKLAEIISPEDFKTLEEQLKQLLDSINAQTEQATENEKMTVANFVSSIQVYLQATVNAFNQVMQEVWNAQDTANEKMQEQLDKENEMIEKKLDKQEEIVEKHKSKIDSIEDELSTARGDRRQHLIDQLNAEMAAQREAYAEQKKIEKEKEANERKQEELEKKRKKQQYQRDMMQAVVNGAMAVTYALVNKWPVPAIPMAALAASAAAAQIGIMAANKPYAKGGLLEGKSHAEGGIPVGNTGIEVEGHEYVIRKKSTAPNIEILDYINKSERKLDLDDFIEFYSSGKLKKNITQMSPSRKFAEGGTIPTLNNDYSFNDRLLDAFEDYSNRPVVVSVRDINARQKAVRDVQVLAGLDE